jgi:hypothetical protein
VSYSLQFTLGPLTVTVEDVPDGVSPSMIDVDLHLHPHGETAPGQFRDAWEAFGGRDTFPGAVATEQFSVKVEDRNADGSEASLIMFVPSTDKPPAVVPLLAEVLGA